MAPPRERNECCQHFQHWCCPAMPPCPHQHNAHGDCIGYCHNDGSGHAHAACPVYAKPSPLRGFFPKGEPMISGWNVYANPAVNTQFHNMRSFGPGLVEPLHTIEVENGNFDDHQDASNVSQVADTEIAAFGTIETPDARYLITTRTILICRDLAAFKRYKAQHHYEIRVAENNAKGLPPPTPPKHARGKGKRAHPPSSQGGLLHEEDVQNPAKGRQAAASGDVTEPTYQGYPDEGRGLVESSAPNEHHTPNSVPVNVTVPPPDENATARLYIHGQGPDFYLTTKGISREHLKIQYNTNKRVWEAYGLGRNGFFLEDQLVSEGGHKVLKSGARLQIQNIPIIFTLRNVADGHDGSEIAHSENGKVMSFDFTDPHHGGAESSDEEMEDARADFPDEIRLPTCSVDEKKALPPNWSYTGPPSKRRRKNGESSDEDGNDYAEDDEAAAEDNSEDIRETVEKEEQSPSDGDQLGHVPFAPRKRGPGRPPKNGIMSKREEKLLRKQQQEEAKKNLPPLEPGEQAPKRKVGRPRKNPFADGAEGSAERRPYKSRKLKGEDGTEDPEGDKPAKERSQKHKTPPLVLQREDFTEEQLQKPTKNYQLLIDEIMSSAPEKGYSLKQIYKRIQEKWPHFYFRVDTKGWESSVRHNLLGSECFKKMDGNWHRVPGVPLDAGKKRKPSDSTADPRPAMYNGYGQPPYQHHQTGQPGPTGLPGQPHGHQMMTHSTGLGHPNLPPRYNPNGQAYQMHHGPPVNAYQSGGPPHPQGPSHPALQQHQTPATGPANTYSGPLSRPQYPGPQPPVHNSSFATKPQPPQSTVSGSGPASGFNPAQRPSMTRPGLNPPTSSNTPTAHVSSASNTRGVASGPPQIQPPPAPLAPIIEPFIREYIREFRAQLVKSLQNKEGKQADAIAMSVINRGLKLTDRSLVPEAQEYETKLLTIFRQHMLHYPKRRAQAAATSASSVALGSPRVHQQGNKVANTSGSAADSDVQAPRPAGTTTSGGTVPAASSSMPTTGPIQSIPTATSHATTPVATLPASTTRLSTGPVPDPTCNVGSAAPEPSPAAVQLGRGGIRAVPKTIAANPVAPNAGTAVPPVAPVHAPQAAAAAHKAATAASSSGMPSTPSLAAAPIHVAGSVSSSATVAPGVNAARSASGAPSPALSLATQLAPPPAATAGPTSTASAAVAGVSFGATRLSSSTSTPAATGPAPSASRATSTTPGTPATPGAEENVQVLDPKLVDVILNFKKSILPTLAAKLNANLGECLILSAVDRKLGLTDATFLQYKTEVERKNYAEAELTLMQHLETRFRQYTSQRSKQQ